MKTGSQKSHSHERGNTRPKRANAGKIPVKFTHNTLGENGTEGSRAVQFPLANIPNVQELKYERTQLSNDPDIALHCFPVRECPHIKDKKIILEEPLGVHQAFAGHDKKYPNENMKVKKVSIIKLRNPNSVNNNYNRQIKEYLNDVIKRNKVSDITLEQNIEYLTVNNDTYQLPSEHSKALQGQRAVFVSREIVEESGRLLFPYPGFYHKPDKYYPIEGEKHYALSAHDKNVMISPTGTHHIGQYVNTSYKKDNDKLITDEDYINCEFIEADIGSSPRLLEMCYNFVKERI